MSDKELEEYIRTIEPNFDSHLEKGTIEMSNEYYNLLEEKMARLINKNQELKRNCNIGKENLNFYREENQKLKKQLEEYKHHLKCSKEMLEVQGQDGNYNYDSYMLGLYNGMEYIISLFETREPIFRNGKDIEFLSDENQQQEFINFLENEKLLLCQRHSASYEDGLGNIKYVDEAIFNEVNKILKEFKEIIGGKDENTKD